MVSNKYSMREQNVSTVLSLIMNNNGLSRADISRITGLNKATVSDIVNELLINKYVIEDGSGESTTQGGRKPIFLRINGFAGVSISIDLGKDYIISSMNLLNGTVLTQMEINDIYVTKDNVIDNIKYINSKFTNFLINNEIDLVYGVIGLTVAIHGIVHKNKIIFTPHYDLDQIDLYDKITSLLPYPVILENEANLSAVGEQLYSGDHKNMISISIHNGFGAGIIINNKLYYGTDGKSGEVGHMILVPNGTVCSCGNNGCIENYISTSAIRTRISDVVGKDLTYKEMSDYANSNNPKIESILDEVSLFTAIGLNNIISNYNPEIIYINSPLVKILPDYVERIKSCLVNQVTKNTVILPSRLGGKAILYGGYSTTVSTVLNLNFIKLDFDSLKSI